MWSQVNLIDINVQKTKAVLLTPAQKCVSCDFQIFLANEKIDVAASVKTLGVTFHQHLNWDEHVECIIVNVAKACGVLCKLRDTVPQKIKLLLYNSIFASHANYCSLVWGTTSKKNLTRSAVMQKKALRHVAHITHDALTGHLFSSLKFIPIFKLYDFNLSVKYMTSVTRNKTKFLNLCKLKKPGEAQYNI